MQSRSKNKSRKSSFEKERSKGKYRVETGETTQENTQLADLLSKVLTSKDEKDIQLPDSEEGLQQLQSALTQIPQLIGEKDEQMKDSEDSSSSSSSQSSSKVEENPKEEQHEVNQLLSLLKQYNENTEQMKDVQEKMKEENKNKGTPMYLKEAQEEQKQVEQMRLQKHKETEDKKDAPKGQSVYEKYWQITIPKNYLEEQQKNNTKAAGIYKENSEGRDPMETSMFEGEVMLKVNRKDVSDLFEKDSLETMYVRINEHSIYYAQNKTSGYRGLLGSLEFEDIITKDDYTLIGKCCQNVYMIQEERVNGEELYCFQIDTANTNWLLCTKDKGSTEGWRNNLNGFVIVWDLKRQGIFDAKELKKKQGDICAFPIGYNYVNQDQWPCMCGEGLAQSPINLVTKEAKELKNAKTDWKYKKASNLITKQFWKETITMGTFGQFEYMDDNLQKFKYTAKEVRFKFKSEHSVDGKYFDCEMQIVHENEQKEKAILSIFLQPRTTGYEIIDELIGKFTIDLYADRKQHKAGFIGCLDATPDLMHMLEKKDWKMNFFTYLGSDTLPPCYENVRWFVYELPMQISPQELNKIRRTVLGDQNAQNQRHQMPLMDRVVEYWQDPCPVKLPEPPQNFQYVRMDGTREVYGIMKKDQELGFEDSVHFKDKRLELEALNDEQHDKIPRDVFDTLVKKFQLYISGAPEEYLYYGKDSKWKQDYTKLVGNIQAKQAKDDFMAQQAARRRRR